MSGGKRISVVITAHDEAAHIRRTLLELAGQDGVDEVVLVDDRSSDATRDEALAAGLPGLRLLTGAPDPASPLTTRQQALDMGFRAARGQVIITIDADTTLKPGWLHAMAAPVLAGRADAVAGPVGFSGRGWIARWQSVDAAWYHMACATLNRAGVQAGAMFGNLAFRADLYRQIGGFAAIGPALTEDLAFTRALQDAGCRLHYVGGAQRVSVHACPDFGALIRRTLRITRAPVSLLAVILTLWPLSLLLSAVGALLTPPGLAVLGLRYATGVALTGWAVWRHGARRHLAFAALYEPLVLAIAVAAAIHRFRQRRIAWGGRHYD